jgi:hypothetical protein
MPGSPSRLVFTSSTANLASGAARDLTVELRDGSGNLVAATPTVSFSQTGGKGSVTGLPASTAAVSGTAAHTVIGFRGGPVTIAATVPPLAAASTAFTVAPGPRGRKLTLALARRVLSGRVGGGPACGASARVKIEMRLPKSRRWKRVRSLVARRNGSFSTRVSKIAAYRARVALQPGCAAATSPIRRVTR